MTSCGGDLAGVTLHPGRSSGRVLRVEPLSFWGGTDLRTGVITDGRHAQKGMCISGRVLTMRSGRGSSSSSVLAEQLRAGVGPAAIVMAQADPIVVTGALVAAELYGHELPIIQLSPDQLALVPDGCIVTVDADDHGARIRSAGSTTSRM